MEGTTTPKRRRIHIAEFVIDQSGQYEALTIRLPDNAKRVTGVMTTSTQLPEILSAFTGWVILGAPGQVPGAVLERWLDATQYNRLPTGINKLSNNLSNPEGFQTLISDELRLTLLTPAAGQSAYVFYPKVLGTPRFVDARNQEVLPVGPPSEHSAQDGSYLNPTTVCYELPANAKVFFPPTFTT